MGGTDLDIHALAANVRHLSEEMGTFQRESKEWRKNITDILVKMSDYTATKDIILERQSKLEDRVSLLEKWQIKTAAIGATALFLIEVLFKFFL